MKDRPHRPTRPHPPNPTSPPNPPLQLRFAAWRGGSQKEPLLPPLHERRSREVGEGGWGGEALLLLLLFLSGCVGTPSPLTPNVHGSVGLPHFGVLTHAVQLPKRTHAFRMLRETSPRWGTPRLVATIQHAAAVVSRLRPGAPLLVGDLSAKHGGFRSGHKSHRTGRDVDLLLYCTTPDGRSIPSPGFVLFGPDGLAETPTGTFVRFDVERNWQFVKALVTSPKADVQWIFLARWLEALLIEHARARGEDMDLIWKAENVLLQPRDSAPHDDHFHVRIACTQDELVHGCDVHGPAWPWLPNPPVLGDVPDEELLVALLDGLLPTPGGLTEAGLP